jgi:hypothetical protein
MFEYANELPTTELTVLANADGVLAGDEETLAKLTALPRGRVMALSVAITLTSASSAPTSTVLALYSQGTQRSYCSPTPRCRERSADPWLERVNSWDGFLFRRPLPALSQHILPDDIQMNMRARFAPCHPHGKSAL